ETLLRRLRPERREVGWNHVAGDDFAACALECGNLRGEIAIHRLIAARIDQAIASGREWLRQPKLRIAPRVAIGVVGEQPADHLIGRRLLPEREKRRDHIFEAPEE